MAEATVESGPKFFCHQCTQEINPKLPEFTCPTCQSGFIEELPEDNGSPQEDMVLSLPSLDQMLDTGSSSDEDVRSLGSVRSSHSGRIFPRVISLRSSASGNRQGEQLTTLLGQMLSQLDGIMTQNAGGQRTALNFHPMSNLFNMHGNPGDYAWGTGGLDDIITQFLNQLEGSGPPPADKEDIDKLPTVCINKQHIEKNAECCVCMEEFSIDEKVCVLPCQHLYHTDCIVPWLKMHGTCPVCRKTLDGKSTETPTDGPDEDAPSTSHHLPSMSYDDEEQLD